MTHAPSRKSATAVALALLSLSVAACGGGGGGGGEPPAPPTLTVTRAGYGEGTIQSSLAGLTCDLFTCTQQSSDGPTLTLTASAYASSTFKGWEGAGCTGTGPCVVTLDASRAVTATFDWLTTAPDAWHAQNVGRPAVDLAPYVAFTAQNGAFPLVANGAAAPLVVNTAADGEYPGVVRAVNDLAKDVKSVTQQTPTVANATAGAGATRVIIGTIGHSPLIQALVDGGKLDEAKAIEGKWETWITKVVDGSTLVIAGSDQRGTIYGVYDLSRGIGVSPWYFWDDVAPAQQSALYVLAGVHTRGQPAVKYRGFFINDEDPDLNRWWTQYNGKGTFDARFYAIVFETMLRLRANYLWPAVWGKQFDINDPQNHATAKAYGIVMGTPHDAPMDRAIDEWGATFRSYGVPGDVASSSAYSYMKYPEAVRAYWTDGIKRKVSGGFEDVVSVGMRGSAGDTSLGDGTALPLMRDILSAEQRVIARETGQDPAKTPQLWALYKEVQGYWDRGLRTAPDVTMMFCDDNWGNMRALPEQDEPARSGGYGMYYHFDYVGSPRSYMWVDTINLASTWEQLRLAYDYGVDRIWVVNAGDFKGLERPTQFFLDVAWSPENYPAPADVDGWQTRFAAENLGAAHAQDVADVLHGYERLQSRRKPEMLNLTLGKDSSGKPALVTGSTFSLVSYREMERVVAEWGQLRQRAEAVAAALDQSQQAAYFQLVLYAVQAGENAYRLRQANFLNLLYRDQGRAATPDQAAIANARLKDDQDLEAKFDTIAPNNKWLDFRSQPHFAFSDYRGPQGTDVDSIYPALVPAKNGTYTLPSGASLGFAVEGSEAWWGSGPTATGGKAASTAAPTLPAQSPYQTTAPTYLELFARGDAPVGYSITVDTAHASWVTVTPASGTLDPAAASTTKQVRAAVSVNWSAVSAGDSVVTLTVHEGSDVHTYAVTLPLSKPAATPDPDVFVEASGHVSIEAMHTTREPVGKGEVSWLLIPDIGRTESGYTPVPQKAPAQTPGGDGPHLEYDVQLYTAGTPITVWVYASPRNDVLASRTTTSNGIRYAVSFDDQAPTTVNITDQTKALDTGGVFQDVAGWQLNVADNVARTSSTHTVGAGRHTLKLWMVDPTVILQKIVIDTGGLQPSYLGPPESWNANLMR